MVGGLFGGRNPVDVIPKRYRDDPDGKPTRPPMTPEQRAIALQVGVELVGQMLRKMDQGPTHGAARRP